jgi:hypothetical protein
MTTTATARTFLECTTAFGFHFAGTHDTAETRKYINIANCANLLSYFPVVRKCVGIWRIFVHLQHVTDGSAAIRRVAYGHIARGLGECLLPNLGPLILILDIAMTTLRLTATSS